MDTDFRLIHPAFDPVILSNFSFLLRASVSLWLVFLSLLLRYSISFSQSIFSASAHSSSSL